MGCTGGRDPPKKDPNPACLRSHLPSVSIPAVPGNKATLGLSGRAECPGLPMCDQRLSQLVSKPEDDAFPREVLLCYSKNTDTYTATTESCHVLQ